MCFDLRLSVFHCKFLFRRRLDRNERRIDLFLIGKNIPLLIMRRRIDLCFNVDILRLSFCKFSVRIFLFSKDYEERL